MRRRAILEGAVEAAELLLDLVLRDCRSISNALTIVSGYWLRIEPEAISKPLQTASYWNALMRQRILVAAAPPGRPAASRTGYGRSRPSFLPRSIRRTGSRRSSRARSGRWSTRFSSCRRGCGPRRRSCRSSPARRATKKHGVAVLKAELRADRFGALVADVLGDAGRRLRASRLPCARRYSRGPAGPRPAPRRSCGRRRRASRRSWPGMAQTSTLGSARSWPANTLKPGAGEMLGDGLHLDRVAQVRLVGAVFADRRRHRECAAIPW